MGTHFWYRRVRRWGIKMIDGKCVDMKERKQSRVKCLSYRLTLTVSQDVEYFGINPLVVSARARVELESNLDK